MLASWLLALLALIVGPGAGDVPLRSDSGSDSRADGRADARPTSEILQEILGGGPLMSEAEGIPEASLKKLLDGVGSACHDGGSCPDAGARNRHGVAISASRQGKVLGAIFLDAGIDADPRVGTPRGWI